MLRRNQLLTRDKSRQLACIAMAAGGLIASNALADSYSWSTLGAGDWYQTPWTHLPPPPFPPSGTPGSSDIAIFGNHPTFPFNGVESSTGQVAVGQIDAKGGITTLFGKAVYTGFSGYDQHFNLDVGTINVSTASTAVATLTFADQGNFVTTTSQSYIHNQLNVGKAGVGYMDISSGYRITLDPAADANIGSQVGSSGYLSVAGSQTSTIQFGGGTMGGGTMGGGTMGGGTQVIASSLTLGHITRVGAAGAGTLFVTGGASLYADDINVGDAGTGNGTIIINSVPFGAFVPLTSAFTATNLYLGGGSIAAGGGGTLQLDSGLTTISNTLKLWGGGRVIMNGGQLNVVTLDTSLAPENAFQFNNGLLVLGSNGFSLGTGQVLGTTLELTQGKNLSMGSSAGTITVTPSGTLNIVGGSLYARGIDRKPGGTVIWTKGQLQLVDGFTVDPVEGVFSSPTLEVTGTNFGDWIVTSGPIRVGTTGAATVSVTSTAPSTFSTSSLSTSSGLVLAPSAAGSASVFARSKGRILAAKMFIGGESFESGGGAAGGSATVTVSSGGTVAVSGRTHLYDTGTLVLDGGHFQTGSISYDSAPNVVFNSGTFQLNTGTLFVGTGAILGSNLTISSGKALIVGGTTHVLPSGNFAVTTGTFQTGTFLNQGVLDVTNAPGGKLVFNPTDVNKGKDGTYRGIFENGYWAPGESPGITNIDGELDLTVQGTLEIELAGPGTGTPGVDFDQLFIVGGAGHSFKAGGTLKILPLSGALPGTYRIVNTGGNGATVDTSRFFANLADGVHFDSGGLRYDVAYDVGHIDVTLISVPEPTAIGGLLFSSALLLRRRRVSRE